MNYLKNEVLWQIFHAIFICISQISMFVMFTLPIYKMIEHQKTEINIWFICSTLVAAGFLVIETIADQQQWNFQQDKKSGKIDPSGDVERGFLTHGLFSVSRHPNYFGELGFWWAIWLMSFSLIQNPVQSGIIGPISLTGLFVGSTIFTERISSSKYPQYKKYQSSVSAVIPWFPKQIKDE